MTFGEWGQAWGGGSLCFFFSRYILTVFMFQTAKAGYINMLI